MILEWTHGNLLMLRDPNLVLHSHAQGQLLQQPHAGPHIDRDRPAPGQPSLYGLWMDPEYVTQIALAGAEEIHGAAQEFRRDVIGHCHNLELFAPGYKP
jgi:hypothetical protein